MKFSNQIILITGAAGDIAINLAKQFISQGGIVWGWDKNSTFLKNAQKQFSTKEKKSLNFRTVNITHIAKINQAVKEIIRKNRKVDVLINHAGFTECEIIGEITPKIWEREVTINLNAGFYVTKTVLPHMKKNHYGSIVTVGTVNIDRYYGNPAYSAAKAGLLSFCRSVAGEYGRYNIRSNVVSPGSVRTRGWDLRIQKDPEIFKKILKWYPLKRLVTPEAVAKAILFLASNEADCITGVNLRVDAGLSTANIPLINDISGNMLK